ncbi:MAG: 1-(5-phosphoribosyl)-5-[(5-phosphoribosylamino)methylideneamino]imidazole-4-carboxamide isomerase [Maricaulaceae bacterium]|jgi:phosphoribosylformimino-5-aminoimidazole carboxamide ribotide isomerase
MLIYPAVDLIEGRVVRLMKGAFDQKTVYDLDPAEALAGFLDAGARWAHVVDLDGAKAGEPRQHELIGALAKTSKLNVQAAGGVRTLEHVRGLLKAGVARVVIGSLAVTEPATVARWLEDLGEDRIALALDVRVERGTPYVTVKGWTETTQTMLWDALDAYPRGSLRHVLVTNVARDGAMEGPDLNLISDLVHARPDLAIQASGGVRSIADLKTAASAGAAGAVVGRALYEGALDLREAVDACA